MYNKQIIKVIDRTLGYEYFMDKEHPLASKTGRVYYHRHAISIKIGRWIERHEVVHHLDGNRANNQDSNLILLTNKSHPALHFKNEIIEKTCNCGKAFKTRLEKTKFCSEECSRLASRKFNVNKSELKKLVWELPTLDVAKIFGVSDVAVAKRCKLLGIEKPPRGYWNKIKHGINPGPMV